MRHREGIRLALATAVGLALGSVMGRTVGFGLRSDNVPFFVLLGALAGMAVGLAVGHAIERRHSER